MIVKTNALVLRMVPFSETSRIVTWLTDEFGKITTIIKGAQRRNSAFLGQYDLFYSCELLFYLKTYHGLHVVKECSPLKMRVPFRSRWKRTACASYFSDIVSRISPVHAAHPDLYLLLDFALDVFCECDPAFACVFWFELKLMDVMGLAPQLSDCVKCRRPLNSVRYATNERKVLFSCAKGGGYCPDCSSFASADAVALPPDILGLLRFWQSAPAWRSAQASKCSAGQNRSVEGLLGAMLRHHMGVPLDGREIAMDLLRTNAVDALGSRSAARARS